MSRTVPHPSGVRGHPHTESARGSVPHTASSAQAPYALGMADQIDPETTEVEDEAQPLFGWEIPEIAAMTVLVAFAVLVVGGLVAGIIASTEASGPFIGTRHVTGAALTYGATWAGPLLAIALLGVVGVGCWQIEVWKQTEEEESLEHDDCEVRGHIGRACRIGVAAQVALILTLVGSIAALIGKVMFSLGTGAQDWVRYVISGASVIAVFAITAGGWRIGHSARAAVPRGTA